MTGSAASSNEGNHLLPPAWLLILLVLLCGGVLAWRVPLLMRAIDEREKLGADAMITNGFDLGDTLSSDDTLLRWGSPEEIIPIDSPLLLGASDVDELGENFRTRFLISSSEIIGVVIDGEARAYPLRILQWHEVVNDIVAGEPICVIYHPLSETMTVFRRAASQDGTPSIFGSSGLVVDCCMLIHDRLGSDNRSMESLWLPTEGRAIAGPMAGTALELLPFQLTTWDVWRQQHPDTRVVGMVKTHERYYKKEPYSPYRLRDKPRYPYSPRPEAGIRKNLARMIVTRDEQMNLFAEVAEGATEETATPHIITSWFAVYARGIRH